MSSLKNAFKSNKSHKERHQPEARAHLGLLEKKKDYQRRAKDYNEKKEALKLLRKRALNRNPDEFAFRMVRSKLDDGEHVEKPKEDECTPEQLQLMQTQDLKYISHKRTQELKKIAKLKSELHVLDAEGKPANKHVFFVDTKEEAKNFSVAERLSTHPALLSRTYNRPRLDDLKKMDLNIDPNNETIAEERAKAYRHLQKRIAREKQLLVAQQKMEIKRHLQNKTEAVPERVNPGTKDAPPLYKWKPERKR